MPGLNLERCRQHETADARLASEIARNLSYAGLALIWIYRSSDNRIPMEFIPSALLFGFFFLFDLGQYVYKANYWAKVYREKEDQPEFQIRDPDGTLRYKEDKEFSIPSRFLKTVDDIYNSKITMVVGGYLVLAAVLGYKFFTTPNNLSSESIFHCIGEWLNRIHH
jgi:hypothetical protein